MAAFRKNAVESTVDAFSKGPLRFTPTGIATRYLVKPALKNPAMLAVIIPSAIFLLFTAGIFGSIMFIVIIITMLGAAAGSVVGAIGDFLGGIGSALGL